MLNRRIAHESADLPGQLPPGSECSNPLVHDASVRRIGVLAIEGRNHNRFSWHEFGVDELRGVLDAGKPSGQVRQSNERVGLAAAELRRQPEDRRDGATLAGDSQPDLAQDLLESSRGVGPLEESCGIAEVVRPLTTQDLREVGREV